MDKINGYTKEEAQSFIRYVCAGKTTGKSLTAIFEGYSALSGRAKGSIRNYYYALLKNTDDKQVKELLSGTQLKAENVTPFTDEEADKILKAILLSKSKGVSVRQAVLKLSDGNDKLMLRYQNKYRNTLAKQPEKIKQLLKECNLDYSDEGRKKIEDKINSLYDDITSALKADNERLTDLVKKLTDENRLLKLQVKNLQ
jgi:Mg2+ and Co2+ transporter CorA